MDLTPVRIRGKKRKHPSIAILSQPSSAPTQASQESNRSRTSKTSKSRKIKSQAMAATPTLQGLPQELLEMIFLYSMNTSLPRASPALGRKLSSKPVLLEFVKRNFFDTVDHRANIRDREITSDPMMQSELLSYRFFTWEFFLTYVQKAQNAYIKLRGKAWEKTGVEIPGVKQFDGLWPYSFTKITYLGFAEKFYIPEKLLHGPWNKSKTSLLYTLVSMNGEIDWEGSMAGEMAKEGIKEAIQEDNERAVAALSVLLGVARAISTEMIRYAVVDCRCHLNVLRHLLFNAQILAHEASKDQLDFHDPKLWAWAERHEQKGEGLKGMLKSAEDFSLKFYFDTEVGWNHIVAFPYSGSKFDTLTTFDVVSRELLMNLYRNYGRRITRGRRERGVTITENVVEDS